MVTFSVSIQALLVILGFTLAIPFNSRDEICHQSPSFPPKRRAETLLIVATTHVLITSTRASGLSAADPVTGLSPLISSSVVTVTVVIPASMMTGYVTSPSSSTVATETAQVVSPQPTHETEPSSIQTAWSTPPRMTDLSSFGITYFPSGQQNIELVSSLPFESSQNSGDDGHSLIRVLYPAHSVNPAQSPVGGASFYASPIELSSATNVSLQYRIFFPASFDWVRGGKLPGLYGGRTSCSGGTDAEDCFSTRLMWRAGGAGELYLYAPKSHQSPLLCLSPGSTCNADYGFSVGRGSFVWTTGTWTTVTQTIVLNTDGKANGWFMLHIDDKLAIERRDIYYRHGDRRAPVKPTKTISEPSITRIHTLASATKSTSSGLLGDLLNPLLGHGLKLSSGGVATHDGALDWTDRPQRLLSVDADAEKGHSKGLIDANVQLPFVSADANLGDEGPQVSINVGEEDDRGGNKNRPTEQVGLVGIFFSTFFGGHGDRYATPEDQYIWFKDFSLTVNI